MQKHFVCNNCIRYLGFIESTCTFPFDVAHIKYENGLKILLSWFQFPLFCSIWKLKLY